MKIKNVVKVMNFHSLLRVDSARRKAEKYFKIEQELNQMIASILYNRNFILDKKSLRSNPSFPVLDIYIGNDFGFCGNFNQEINNDMSEHTNNFKVIIGKKMHATIEKVLLRINKEDFIESFKSIEDIILDGIRNMSYSEINIIYNHYNSINSFSFVRKRIFPVEFDGDSKKSYTEDFVVETDINEMLIDLVTLYICYQIRIAEANSWAAENVMRQQITRESLKKIDEIDFYKLRAYRKQKKYKDFKKLIENYRRKGI